MTRTVARAEPRAREPLLRGDEAERAFGVARFVLGAAMPRLAAEAGPPESICRYGGAVLVAEALARAGRADEADLRALLREAMVFAPDRLSLYDGAGGLLVALDAVDPEQRSFAGARAHVRGALARSLHDLPPAEFGDPASFDMLAGVAGRAAALGRATLEDPRAAASLRAFAHAVADEAERRIASGNPVLGATINLGVSHGLSGLLAALNLALPHDRAPARRFVDILLACSHEVGGARRWGAVWRRDERPTPRRAWCYQTAGIAAVLDDRARLEGDEALRALATDAFAALLDQPDEDRWDAGLCHGRSGVAALGWRFAGDERLERYARRLARAVLDEFDPGLPLGYRTLDAGGGLAERLCLLDGALGIALFLIDAATAQERRWLPLFGLLPDEPATTSKKE